MPASDVVVIHYHEIALKGGNRPHFEKKLIENIKRAIKDLGAKSVRRTFGRIVVDLEEGADLKSITENLKRTFGIQYFAPARKCPQDMKGLKETALEVAKDEDFETFRISSKRSNKAFPHTSMDINRDVGAVVADTLGKKVKLKDPDLTISVEIVNKEAYVFSEKILGAGGLPTGSAGKAVALLSGGIDSPVAAYRMMKRGLKIIFCHFHSAPITSDDSVEKAKELVKVLAGYQGSSDLFSVPLGNIQERIWKKTPADLRMVLYRRMMVRIAEEIAREVGAKALVTGESLGQVASQTMENLSVIEKAATMSIFRPLVGDDKNEIIDMAQRIGTFEISILPHEDCCTLFVPKHPETKADPDFVDKVESPLDVDALVKMGVEGIEKDLIDP
jgi:thiamine biosynthesis protein ThiI